MSKPIDVLIDLHKRLERQSGYISNTRERDMLMTLGGMLMVLARIIEDHHFFEVEE